MSPVNLLVASIAASSVIISLVYGIDTNFFNSSQVLMPRTFLYAIQTYAPLALLVFFDSETLFSLLIKYAIVFLVLGTIFQQVGKNTAGKFGKGLKLLGDTLAGNAGYLLAVAAIAKIKSRG